MTTLSSCSFHALFFIILLKLQTFLRAKKFQKKPFPLFDALGELYDGHIAQGTWNITSTQPPQNLDDREQLNIITGIEEGDCNQLQEDDARLLEDDVVIVGRAEQRQSRRSNAPTTNQEKAERTEQRLPRKFDAPTINQQKEAKRMKKEALEGLVGRYLDMKTKQVEDEAARVVKEKEAA
jgi:hypothetical protein